MNILLLQINKYKNKKIQKLNLLKQINSFKVRTSFFNKYIMIQICKLLHILTNMPPIILQKMKAISIIRLITKEDLDKVKTQLTILSQYGHNQKIIQILTKK
ncbi:hypothetical protein TTHERM_000214698 (macronuclear) [Tetrahymena thermophila SB210]|uniref:Uncharacterized protein n=1 Tax=Tetrahymena thermophila (strain SB210) TaxID=312017 RepID=W7XBB9_TETTS|nr:hypothetical protein TTHERM_000214698 [Tetrahymena thermophila SB210]EWS76675.1 hypothetical protein TTHERM_000214698 [Tetrahymena thermophila SB210]|eukprot:XP_012650843.1 hypothetical protein TTHERM_000214698 [Tetrahymena thermophila SB210]